MVKEIGSSSEFKKELSASSVVVVDFHATWCGPCRNIAPFVENLSRKYPNVSFLKVDGDQCRDITQEYRISAFPTFLFFVKGQQVNEMKGANSSKLETLVVQYNAQADGANPFGGAGNTLGGGAPVWDGVGMPPTGNARDARLKAFGQAAAVPKAEPVKEVPAAAAASTAMEVCGSEDDEDEMLKMAMKLSTEQDTEDAAAVANTKDSNEDDDMVPVPVDNSILSQLVDMGFADVRSRKGIVHGKTLEGALSWLTDNQDNADIDQPYLVRRADTIPKKPLTEEEKAIKMADLRRKIEEKKAARIIQEKKDEVEREKERRERGKGIEETEEHRNKLQKQREHLKIKKEKEDAIKERTRLRAEIARDKEMRRANKGVLPSVLGVDGYSPSCGAKMEEGDAEGAAPTAPGAGTATATKAPPAPPVATPAAPAKVVQTTTASVDASKVDAYIQTVGRYRTSGDGGHALKLLLTFINNVVKNPTELKYRSINPESGPFRNKLAPLVGPMGLLKCLGFHMAEDGKLKIDDEVLDLSLFSSTAVKLSEELSAYCQRNNITI